MTLLSVRDERREYSEKDSAGSESGSLSSVRRGEGWGEGPIDELRNSLNALTPALSHGYMGEGAGSMQGGRILAYPPTVRPSPERQRWASTPTLHQLFRRVRRSGSLSSVRRE